MRFLLKGTHGCGTKVQTMKAVRSLSRLRERVGVRVLPQWDSPKSPHPRLRSNHFKPRGIPALVPSAWPRLIPADDPTLANPADAPEVRLAGPGGLRLSRL